MPAAQPEKAIMITHVCPICHQQHLVRAIRVVFAYGRQLTCSPHCESERRKRMRHPPTDASTSPVLHAWVLARTTADMARANSMLHTAPSPALQEPCGMQPSLYRTTRPGQDQPGDISHYLGESE
jgi:hypothetical protein